MTRHLRTGAAALLALVLAAAAAPSDPFAKARAAMVTDQIESRGVRDPRVLDAMREVPRHLFIPASQREEAHDDHPLPIGHGQTISQPYIVALMTELARPASGEKALEVGTGSGYQAAVLSRLVGKVFTIEIVEPLGRSAEKRLAEMGYANVRVRVGDGYEGWPEEAPFDVILVTAAPDHVPPALVRQLAPGGRLVIPVGPVHRIQSLQLLEKRTDGTIETRDVLPVRFVPLTRSRPKR
jgi:protein-L-isoaspartate(D-aspartate) O-methyltransferase